MHNLTYLIKYRAQIRDLINLEEALRVVKFIFIQMPERFSLKQIVNRRKKWKYKHGKYPKGFVVNIKSHHIYKYYEPKYKQQN